MIKIKTKGYFPFVGTAEKKKSQAGNEYISIGVCQSVKKQDGTKDSIWFNMVDRRDLLTLASMCENLYHKICEEDAKDYEDNQTSAPAATNDDSVPF